MPRSKYRDISLVTEAPIIVFGLTIITASQCNILKQSNRVAAASEHTHYCYEMSGHRRRGLLSQYSTSALMSQDLKQTLHLCSETFREVMQSWPSCLGRVNRHCYESRISLFLPHYPFVYWFVCFIQKFGLQYTSTTKVVHLGVHCSTTAMYL